MKAGIARLRRYVTVFALVLCSSRMDVAAEECTFEWRPGSGLAGVDGEVYALTAWDPDGAGPQEAWVVAGGRFSVAGNALANNIAAWDGSNWHALGTGIDGSFPFVYALAVFNGDLIAAGDFSLAGDVDATDVARWDGSEWHGLGEGITGQYEIVHALSVYEGALIVGGSFAAAGGVTCQNVAIWDGQAWEPLGIANAPVTAFTVHNNSLIAGGACDLGVVRWDGSVWQPMGDDFCGGVLALATYQGELIAGGTIHGFGIDGIARWDGVMWHQLGPGIYPKVESLAVFNGDLIVGGDFFFIGPLAMRSLARWDGNSWGKFGPGLRDTPDSFVHTLLVFGDDVFVGGRYWLPGDNMRHIAVCDGTAWHGVATGTDSFVTTLAVSKDELIMGGAFLTLDGVDTSRAAKWNGSAWDPLEVGTNGWYPLGINMLEISGSDTFAGGYFSSNGLDFVGVARYAGEWQLFSPEVDMNVWDLTTFNGDIIIAGDPFYGAVYTNPVLRWDGSGWEKLGVGIDGTNSYAKALELYAGELIVGGSFTGAGGGVVNHIARWNGLNWQPLGSGMNGSIEVLGLYDGELIAGGYFTSAGGAGANRIAAWDGTTWRALAAGVGSGFDYVGSVATYNGELIASGRFNFASGANANNIARWNGVSWRPLGEGLNQGALALAQFNGELFAGGGFTIAGGQVSAYWARWGPTGDPPMITQSPSDLDLSAGQPAEFTLTAVTGTPVNYQWRRNGVDLSDGPAPGGGTIYGSGTNTLLLTSVGLADAGNYDVIVTDPCGATVSDPATLSVGVPSAVITAAVSRRSCDLGLASFNGVGPTISEPRVGGIETLVIRFNTSLAPSVSTDEAAVEEQRCTTACPACLSDDYAPSGVAPASATTGIGSDTLTLTFMPGLPNARKYRITMGPNITSAPNQFVEIRGLLGDVNSDGRVNGADRSTIVSVWTGSNFTCGTDLDGNGRTHGADRSIVVGAWTGPERCAP